MHPDSIITGLRRELESLDKAAADYQERKNAINREIEHASGLPRPAATAEESDTVVDQAVGYLAGLKLELERASRERWGEIKAEIARVEHAIRSKPDMEEPESAAEIPDGPLFDEEAQPEGILTKDDGAGDGLEDKSRRDLNEIASSLGVESPEKLPNKDAVLAAIRSKPDTEE